MHHPQVRKPNANRTTSPLMLALLFASRLILLQLTDWTVIRTLAFFLCIGWTKKNKNKNIQMKQGDLIRGNAHLSLWRLK